MALSETSCLIGPLPALGGCRQGRQGCSVHPQEERAITAFSVCNKIRATAEGWMLLNRDFLSSTQWDSKPTQIWFQTLKKTQPFWEACLTYIVQSMKFCLSNIQKLAQLLLLKLHRKLFFSFFFFNREGDNLPLKRGELIMSTGCLFWRLI